MHIVAIDPSPSGQEELNTKAEDDKSSQITVADNIGDGDHRSGRQLRLVQDRTAMEEDRIDLE